MQDGSAQKPGVPVVVLEGGAPGQDGPAPSDWRIAELALTGAASEDGWVALRVKPLEVLPLVEDAETAEVLAAMRAQREGVRVWQWTQSGGWSLVRPLPS